MRTPTALVADIVCVLVFALVGRASHSEGLGVLGVLVTAWPFVAGCLLGSLAVAAARRPGSLGSGLVVWASTVVVGVALRALTGAGVPVAFVLVTAVVLGLLLLGWRGMVALVHRRGSARGAETDPAAERSAGRAR